MSASKLNTILIVEPKPELAEAYQFLPQESNNLHLTSTQKATQYLQDKTPDLIIISASYSPVQIFNLLEQIKEASSNNMFLIPVVFMIDLEHKTSFIPGTHWGGQLGIINTLSSKKEVELMLSRLSKEQKSFGYN
jgi:PleD family two-component response regulator